MNIDINAADRLALAAIFATKQHEGQFRDDGKTPYAVHVFRVVEHLRRFADERDEAVLCAGYLHDTIEDSGINIDVLTTEFSSEVALLVAEVTNDNRLPKAERRAAMLAHVPHMSPKAKRVKLADRLDNITDLLRGNGSRTKCERYVSETEKILDGCVGACPPLEAAVLDALNLLRQRVKEF